MATLFALLFLLSLIFLIWGLLSPKSLSKFSKKPMTRKQAGIGYGLFVVLFFVLTGVTAPNKSMQNKTQSADTSAAQQQITIKEVAPKPVITTKQVTETEPVPYSSKTVNDVSLTKGTTKVTTKGVNGVKTRTYEVTLSDGVQTDKKLVKEKVTTQPVTEVVANGTKVAATAPAPQTSCDSNYSGACVPVASDVDCAGGSGNGPAYVRGPVYVIGNDIYKLDGNGDGVGCE